jgi:toxin secretion/phage lysis holin
MSQGKGFLVMFTAVLTYLYNCVNELLGVLYLLVFMDYITGIIKIYVLPRKKFVWKKGVIGIIKKIMYIFIIVSAFLLDFTIDNISDTMNLSFEMNGKIGIITIIFLIGNEGFSLINNLILIGLPVPKILLKFYNETKEKANK